MVAMGFWAWWFIPETKGKTLEEMEVLFKAQPVGDQEWAVNEKDQTKVTTSHVETI